MRRNSSTLLSYYYRLRSLPYAFPYVCCFHCHRQSTFESSFVLALLLLSRSSLPTIWLRTKSASIPFYLSWISFIFLLYSVYQLRQLRLRLNYTRTTFLWSLLEAIDDVRSSRYFEAIDLWIFMKFIFINRKLLHNLCFNDRRRSQY